MKKRIAPLLAFTLCVMVSLLSQVQFAKLMFGKITNLGAIKMIGSIWSLVTVILSAAIAGFVQKRLNKDGDDSQDKPPPQEDADETRRQGDDPSSGTR